MSDPVKVIREVADEIAPHCQPDPEEFWTRMWGKLRGAANDIEAQLAAAQVKLTERDESFERLFQKAMAHDREVAELQEKLAAYGNYTPAAYEEVHKFYTEWPGGLDEIESALNGWRREAAQAAEAAIGWQPIETAPKDGSAVLGYGRHWESPADAQRGVTAGDHWWAIMLFDIWRVPGWVFAKDGRPTWSEPTHWMPLPEPPK